MTQRPTDVELALLEQFGGSPDPQYYGTDYDVFDTETVRTTDAFGVRVSKRGQQLDTSADIGGVQSGGARRRRRATRRRRQQRSRNQNRRSRRGFNLSMSLRIRTRSRSRHA